VLRAAGIDEAALAPVIARETAELARRRTAYLGDRAHTPLAGRTAIVVDDGIATGATMRAALRAVRLAAPDQIVLAVPVAAPDALVSLAQEADKIVCLAEPDPFFAVGHHYVDFVQIPDSEVISALTRFPPAAREDTIRQAGMPDKDLPDASGRAGNRPDQG
jgi:predicted phosphoribosyltransferase